MRGRERIQFRGGRLVVAGRGWWCVCCYGVTLGGLFAVPLKEGDRSAWRRL